MTMNAQSALFHLGGFYLDLRYAPDVFEPNLTTRLLAESAALTEADRVLDLGCGVGPIAILAAKKGARNVVAIDVMPDAVALARENVERNGVADRVTVMQGDLFEGLDGQTFDVIIDDVSGMAERVSRISPWYPPNIPSGGADGTEPTMRMLSMARKYLAPGGQLYFPVISLATSRKIVQRAHEIFGDRVQMVADKLIPFCDEFKARLHDMEQMKADGLIDFISVRSRHLWKLEIYRATA